MRDLAAFLTVDLQLHIAKEEDVLFPALRGLTAEADVAVVEMIVQHDEVRSRRLALSQSISRLDEGHAAAQAAVSEVGARLALAESAASHTMLSAVK